jgi:hypothetical protein
MDSDDEEVEMAMPIELLDERWEAYRERCAELLKYVATVLRANNKNSRLRVLSGDRLRVLQCIDERLSRSRGALRWPSRTSTSRSRSRRRTCIL